MAIIAHCQPKPEMPSPASGTTRNCPAEVPAVPSPTARPRWLSGSMRVREAMMVGIPAAETATPSTTPAKKVKSGRLVGERHAEDAQRIEQRSADDHGPAAEAIRQLADERLEHAVQQHLQRDREGEARGGPGMAPRSSARGTARRTPQPDGEHGGADRAGDEQAEPAGRRGERGQGHARAPGSARSCQRPPRVTTSGACAGQPCFHTRG